MYGYIAWSLAFSQSAWNLITKHLWPCAYPKSHTCSSTCLTLSCFLDNRNQVLASQVCCKEWLIMSFEDEKHLLLVCFIQLSQWLQTDLKKKKRTPFLRCLFDPNIIIILVTPIAAVRTWIYVFLSKLNISAPLFWAWWFKKFLATHKPANMLKSNSLVSKFSPCSFYPAPQSEFYNQTEVCIVYCVCCRKGGACVGVCLCVCVCVCVYTHALVSTMILLSFLAYPLEFLSGHCKLY